MTYPEFPSRRNGMTPQGPPSQREAIAALVAPLNRQTLVLLTGVRLWGTLAIALLALSFQFGTSHLEILALVSTLGFYMLANLAHGAAIRRDKAVHATGILTLAGEVAIVAVLSASTGGVFSPFLVLYAVPTLEALYFYTTGIALATAALTWLSYVAVSVGAGAMLVARSDIWRPRTLVLTVTADSLIGGIVLMGVFLALVTVFGRGLLGKLSTVEGMLAQTIDALRIKNRVLEEMTITDPLTQLRNRRYFMDRLQKEIDFWHSRNRLRRHEVAEDETFAVAVMDIDDFKLINDGYGHLVGDTVLRAVGSACLKTLRDRDESARLGGDEFALLLRGLQADHVESVLTRLKEAIEREIESAVGHRVGLSLGGVIGAGLDDAEQVLDIADQAMYEGKRGGKGGVVIRAEVVEPPTVAALHAAK